MGKIGYRDQDVMQGKEDEDLLNHIAERLGCTTAAQLRRWTLRFVLDKVKEADFEKFVLAQQDANDKARYDFDDRVLAEKRAA